LILLAKHLLDDNFPAQVRPLFKKENILEKGNYRPVSVLPTISKFVERAIFDQLTDFFNFHFHPSL
jgi:hypothetical protein